jgi:hypothetical protein
MLCLEQKNLHGFLGWLKINGISKAKTQRRMFGRYGARRN